MSPYFTSDGKQLSKVHLNNWGIPNIQAFDFSHAYLMRPLLISIFNIKILKNFEAAIQYNTGGTTEFCLILLVQNVFKLSQNIKWRLHEADCILGRIYFRKDKCRLLIWVQGSFKTLILYNHGSFYSICALLLKDVLYMDFIFHWELFAQIQAAEIINERKGVQQG